MSGSVSHDYKELRKLPNISPSNNTYVATAATREPINMTLESIVAKKLRISNIYIREGLAEFMGTFILIIFGCGVNAQTTLGKGSAGEFLSVNWGWGLGIAFGVFISGSVSGGHINPAVTLAMTLLGRLPVRKLPIYWLGQYLGAIVASACVFGVYQDALDDYDGGVRSVTGPNATAGIWGTYPQGYLSIWSGLGDQVLGTTMLVLCVMSVTDPKNSMGAPKGLIPLIVGLIVFAIGMTLGLNCGFAINPARDFGPRAFTAMAGWGSETFSAYNYWFWVPIVGPHIGAICGAFFYLLTVGIHLRDTTIEEVVYDDDKKSITLQGPDSKQIRVSIPNLLRGRRCTAPANQLNDEVSNSSLPNKQPPSGSGSKPFRLSIPNLLRGRRYTVAAGQLNEEETQGIVRYTRLSHVSPESPIPEESPITFVDDKQRSKSLNLANE